jgi:hypothetical protein
MAKWMSANSQIRAHDAEQAAKESLANTAGSI